MLLPNVLMSTTLVVKITTSLLFKISTMDFSQVNDDRG